MAIDVGDKLPRFTLPASGGGELGSSDLLGKPLVLYFYPKDHTAGCTLEAQDFRDLHPKFKRRGVNVVGVSRDSVKSHDSFCAKHALPFALLADTDEALSTAFGVIKMKNMYGRKVRGIERSTFLFDGKGVLRRAWRGLRVPGHAEEVLQAAAEL
jgi:peroxiredoxin Q/BCP